MKNRLKLDKKGYEKFLQDIAKVEEELGKLRKYKGKDAIFQGDNWHDNPTLYQAEMEERNLMMKLREMKEQLIEAEIVEKIEDNNGVIDIGDVIRITMLFGDEENDEIFKLVGGMPNFDTDIHEISLNSPLGASVYGKEVGTKVSYQVNGRSISAIIQEKLDLSKTQEDTPSTRSLK